MGTLTPPHRGGHILVFGQQHGKHMELLAAAQSRFQVGVSVENVSHILESTWDPAPDLVVLVDGNSDSKLKKSCAQIKGNVGTCHLPVVVLSSTPAERVRTEWFDTGCIDCIPLDTPAEEFAARIGSHIKTGQYANLLRRTSHDCQDEIYHQAVERDPNTHEQQQAERDQHSASLAKGSHAPSSESMHHLIGRLRTLSLGLLAGRIAHEINNPLSGIINYAQLINDRVDQKEGKLKRFAQAIMREGLRVSHLARDLLLISREEQQDLRAEAIVDVIQPTLSIIRTASKKDGISLKLDIPNDLPEVVCRSREIQQVLLHFSISAQNVLNRRYPDHDENKILLITCCLTTDEKGQWVRTTVTSGDVDPAPPLPASPPAADARGNSEWEQSLSICQSILDRHGGRLLVDYIPDQLMRAHLDLPWR